MATSPTDLSKVQEQLLKQRDALLRQLGLEELNRQAEETLTKAAEESRKRKAAHFVAPEITDGGERRRSLRVRGITAEGTPVEKSLPKELRDELEGPRGRPEGDVAWDRTLKYVHVSRPMAAEIINDVRAATATMLGLPAPPAVGGKAAEEAPSGADAAADAVSSAGGAFSSSAASSSAAAAAGDDDGAPIEITHNDSDTLAEEPPVGRKRLTRASLGKAAASSAAASSSSAAAPPTPSKARSGKASDAAAAGSSLAPLAGFPDGGLTAAFNIDAGYPLPLVDPAAPAAANASSASGGAGKKGGKAAGAGAISPARGAGAGRVAKGAAAAASGLASLQLRDVSAVLKVVPDRVYSVAFHPAADKVIGICGSKAGFVGVWEPDMARLQGVAAPAGSGSVSLSARSKSHGGAGAAGADSKAPAAKRPRRGTAAGEEGESDGEKAEGTDDSAADGPTAANDDEAEEAGEAEADGVGASPAASGSSAGLRFGGSAASGFKRKGPVSADPSAFDEADLPADKVAVFAPHSAPVNYLQVPRGAPHLLVTSSYDGSVRALDFNKGVSWEWLADVKGRGVSAMDVMEVAPLASSASSSSSSSSTSRKGAAAAGAGSASAGPGISCAVLVGTYDGQMALVDPRARSLAAAFQAHDRKVTATSACGGSAYFLSSSSDAKVHVWDVRKMGHAHTAPASSGSESAKRSSSSPSSAASGRVSHVPIASVGSSQAVTSAFFSPLGTRVIATCNDNKLRLWNAVWSGSSGELCGLGALSDRP
jgi:WD40 repeat protein